MVLNRSSTNLFFTLNNDQLEVVQSYKYLGITFNTRRLTTLYTEHFSKIKQKATRRLQCIKLFGYKNDGLRPETAIKLYKLLVRPILEYGAQVLIYDHFYLKTPLRGEKIGNRTDFVDQLEQFQTKALKYLIGCPKSTSSSIVRLFSGVEPLSSRFDLLKLRYFWKLSHGDKHNIAYRLYNCRRRNFLLANKGFTYEVFNLCCKYNAINFWHGKIQGFTNPNIYIKKQVLKFNLKVDLENGNTACGFSDVYLQNVFKYQEKYQ